MSEIINRFRCEESKNEVEEANEKDEEVMEVAAPDWSMNTIDAALKGRRKGVEEAKEKDKEAIEEVEKYDPIYKNILKEVEKYYDIYKTMPKDDESDEPFMANVNERSQDSRARDEAVGKIQKNFKKIEEMKKTLS
ncbi:hypothetical protein TSUD_10580 [Trifolium subterraneum]|nr:hypothetical protein TSUD_10580 [Trifolium subterraneum]